VLTNKYNNKKTALKVDGELIIFDSQAEAARAIELIGLRDCGKISSLTFQPVFLLQATFRRNGKTHRAIKYIADFRYIREGETIIEDVKGKCTTEYKIKKKLFLNKYDDLRFFEVYMKRGMTERIEQ